MIRDIIAGSGLASILFALVGVATNTLLFHETLWLTILGFSLCLFTLKGE